MVDSPLLVIGLDGANREALLEGMNRGDLPTFRSLAESGTIETLKAPLPPTTPVSMSSILTGKSPAEHGVFSFEYDPRDGGGYVDASTIRGDTLFDALADEGMRTVAVNVPMTDADTPGTVVAGFPHLDGPVTDDPGLDSLLRTMGYRVEPTGFEEDMDAFVDDVFDLAEKRFRVADHLIERDWDLFFLMFTGDARLQHYIDDEDVVLDFYRQVDDYLVRLLEQVDDDVTVLVVSDHGFHDVDAVVDIEAWLQDAGYLAASGDGEWAPLYGALDPDRYDLDSTTAFPGAAYMGNIHLSGADADELSAGLGELTHDGERVFRAVHRTEELYGACDGPDLIPVPRRRYSYVAGAGGGIIDTEPEERRAPDREGVIISGVPLDGDQPEATDVRPFIRSLLDTADR